MDSDLSHDEFEEVILLTLQKDLKTISLLIAVVIVVQGLLAGALAAVFWLELGRPAVGVVVGLVGAGVTVLGGYVLFYNVRRAMTINEQLTRLADDVPTEQPAEESPPE